VILQFVLECCAKNAGGISHHSLLSPNINWLPWQWPLTNQKRDPGWSSARRAFSYGETVKVCKNRSTISWDIQLDMPNFVSCWKFRNELCQLFELLDQSSRKFCTIEASLTLLMCTLVYQYSILFQNARTTNDWSLQYFRKICCMATSLKIWEKEVQINHLHPKCFNVVKRLQKLVL